METDASLKGPAHSFEEVLIKNEPLDTGFTEHTHIQSEDSCESEDLPPENVTIKSEIELGDYECTPSSDGTTPQLSKTTERTVTGTTKTFSCDQCSATYSNRNNLDVHQWKHSGYRPFVCKECGSTFDRKPSLVRHELLHTGEKPYPCDICGMRFKQSAHVKSHILTHQGIKPYNCEECGSKFASKHGLTEHQRKHTGDILFQRRFACDLCEKSFVRKEGLNKHKRSFHFGEKPYSCDMCGLRFTQLGHARTHMSTQHNDKSFLPL